MNKQIMNTNTDTTGTTMIYVSAAKERGKKSSLPIGNSGSLMHKKHFQGA